jgi:hypothetical protein
MVFQVALEMNEVCDRSHHYWLRPTWFSGSLLSGSVFSASLVSVSMSVFLRGVKNVRVNTDF